MRLSLFALCALASLLTSCSLNHTPRSSQHAPHLPLEASASEIDAVMAGDAKLHKSRETQVAKDDLKDVVAMGQRVYKWLEVVNTGRAAGAKLSFTSKENAPASPIEKPNMYNVPLLRAEYQTALAATPVTMRAVVLGTGDLPSTLPVSESEFLAAGAVLTRAYDGAARWIMMSNYLDDLASEQLNDVRGYVYFSKIADVEKLLENYSAQSADAQTAIRDALFQMCMNNEDPGNFSTASCRASIANAEKNNSLYNNYKRNLVRARLRYNDAFTLDRAYMREDVEWTSADPGVLHYPFLQPKDSAIASYLKDNVEDEWRLASSGFALKIDFTNMDADGLSRLEFQAGETPHALRGKIVMDENEPITEWLSQWTIRHEFGHLLGFKDCYVEFYDAELKAIVNYQLDTTDIMCSRRGNFKQSHYDRLRAAYFNKH